jgi:hypothetical protein
MKTGQWENMGQARDPNGKRIRAYGMPTDQQNNVYQLEFGGANIGRRNAKTGEDRRPVRASQPPVPVPDSSCHNTADSTP